MKSNRYVQEYSSPINKDYSSLIKQLTKAIEQNKSQDIKPLIEAIKSISDRKPTVFYQDNTAVLEALKIVLEGINKKIDISIPEIKTPEVNFNPVIENKSAQAISYKFEIKRNGANLITEVLATPVGGNV